MKVFISGQSASYFDMDTRKDTGSVRRSNRMRVGGSEKRTFVRVLGQVMDEIIPGSIAQPVPLHSQVDQRPEIVVGREEVVEVGAEVVIEVWGGTRTRPIFLEIARQEPIHVFVKNTPVVVRAAQEVSQG